MRKAVLSFMLYVIISNFYPAIDMFREEWGLSKYIVLTYIKIMYFSVEQWIYSCDL